MLASVRHLPPKRQPCIASSANLRPVLSERPFAGNEQAMQNLQVKPGGGFKSTRAAYCPHNPQHRSLSRVKVFGTLAGSTKPRRCRSLANTSRCRSPLHLPLRNRQRSLSCQSKHKSFLSGRALQASSRPRFIFIARKERGRCIVTATLVEEGTSVTQSRGGQSMETVLAQEIAENPQLVRGRLENGLEYVILPNETPPARFEAHLEVHAGSVDENENEQGIAHIVEHVTFLGSAKRDQLLGTGARSNAYTDFHHTVFHVHSPLVNTNVRNSGPMLPQVLSTLAEVAFQPEFLTSRIEKERKAVLAEAQMMNTIEYRVDCALLKFLHHENALGCRFPIGQTSQVEEWNRDQIVQFWQRWYFPANTTLYLVGDFGQSVEDCRRLIERTFGSVPAVKDGHELTPHVYGRPPQTSNGNGKSTASLAPLKKRHEVRPPVEHVFGCGPLQPDFQPAPVDVFQHQLLQYFMLSIFCKLPVQKITTVGDLRRSSMSRILLSVLSFRLNQRYVEGNPPFIAIDIDISDSAREGCVVSTLTITSEPKDWRGAVQVAVQEVRRLQRYGVTKPELERYQMALLRDAEQAAEQSTSIPSVEMLEYSMDSIGLDHTVMDQAQTFKMLQHWVDTITIEDINKEAASLLSFASHYGSEAELLAEAEQEPERFAPPGPTRTTAIVACYPAFTDVHGDSIGGAAPMQRGASMTTDKHVDPSVAPQIIEEESAEVPDVDIPEGALKFNLTAEEIKEAMIEASCEVEAPADVDVPDSLLPEPELQRVLEERKPHFVPLLGMPDGSPAQAQPDPFTGIVQRRLSNGIKVNYWYSDNEPQSVMIRVCAAGGRALEGSGPGPSGSGSVIVGTRSLSESGTVGTWQREQVELFCISRLLNVVLENDEEFVYMDCSCPVGNGSLQSMMELLHNFLAKPKWEESAVNRAKQMFLSHYKSLHKSLERETADRIMGAMFGPTRRLRDPSPEEIEALTLEGMREALEAQLHAGNVEVNIVGDFKAEELDDLLVKYMGTIEPAQCPPQRIEEPIDVRFPAKEVRQQVWHLKDSDERAAAYIAGKAPPRWGHFEIEKLPARDPTRMVLAPQVLTGQQSPKEREQQTLIRRSHPLYATTTLRLLTEIMNGRLFTTVRDSLGLTYDVSFELSQFDRLRTGYFVIHVTSTPAKIREALAASVDVLRSFHTSPVTQRELLRAQKTLLTRHESDLKTNVYRLGLITHLQAEAVPLKSVQCLRDLQRMYEAATVEDVMQAYHQLPVDDQHIFTCIGTSGPNPLPEATALEVGSQADLGTGASSKGFDVDFAALMNAIRASKNSLDIAKAMQHVKEEKDRKQQDSGQSP